jgi:Di-haem cytochrome c peroxidase
MRKVNWPLLVLVSSVTTTVATGRSSTVEQARLAALPLSPTAPADNPMTPERVALGRLLFWDPILSGQKDVACATCHHPAFGYSDGLDLSIGANGAGLGPARAFVAGQAPRLVKRNSQTRRSQLLPAAQSRRRSSGRWRRTRDKRPGKPRSDRRAGTPAEHARAWPAGPDRIPGRAGRFRLRSNRSGARAKRIAGRRPPGAVTPTLPTRKEQICATRIILTRT